MLDMAVVSVSLTVHLQAMWAAAAIWACGVMVVAMACFGWSLHRDSYTHHAAGWIWACISNVLLMHARYS
jgi:hypothetical protein